MTVSTPPRAQLDRTLASHVDRRARILGIGTAVPQRYAQADAAERLAAAWWLAPRDRNRWERIIRGSGVEYRHAVIEVDAILRATTAERMRLYERHAPPLACAAARCALDDAAIDRKRITDLVVVTCTGFSAPGVDIALVDQLGLAPTVRRTTIGFMGCFGGILGLRSAIGACAADPDACVLVVCIELCSLHLRADPDPENLVASALFADGAAAVVVSRTDRSHIAVHDHENGAEFALGLGGSFLAPSGRDDMTWRITDTGFAMTLSMEVPAALQTMIGSALRSAGCSPAMRALVHPGGPKILDAIEDGLTLPRGGLIESRRILRDFGNMSSGTILFVLNEARRIDSLGDGATLLAFGPGLTIECLPVGSSG